MKWARARKHERKSNLGYGYTLHIHSAHFHSLERTYGRRRDGRKDERDRGSPTTSVPIGTDVVGVLHCLVGRTPNVGHQLHQCRTPTASLVFSREKRVSKMHDTSCSDIYMRTIYSQV